MYLSYISECVLLQIISYDSPRGGVSVITEKGDVTASFLVVQHAKPTDSGTYSCSPSLGETVSVNVHVLRGKYHLCITYYSQQYYSCKLFVGPYMEFNSIPKYFGYMAPGSTRPSLMQLSSLFLCLLVVSG